MKRRHPASRRIARAGAALAGAAWLTWCAVGAGPWGVAAQLEPARKLLRADLAGELHDLAHDAPDPPGRPACAAGTT